MKFILVLIISMFMFSCNNNPQKPKVVAYNYKPPLDNRELVNRLQDSIIQYGNSRAYNELASYYVLEEWNEELLYYALLMANKYNSAEGHYHVYYSLSKPRNGGTLEQLDNKTKCFAFYHLLISYEMNFESSKYEVEAVFGENKSVPKSSYYLQEYIKAEQGITSNNVH